MQSEKDKKTNAHVSVGVDFLEKKLLDVQVKVIELDERPEARHAEYFVGDQIKQRK